MKLKHLFLACLSVGLLAVGSCKKDGKDEVDQKTVAERIQTKWAIQNLILHGYIDGEDSTINLPAFTSDYFDIRSDNKIYSSFRSQLDTLDYELRDDSTLIIKDYGYFQADAMYKIRNLTNHTLTLYTKENVPDSPADYIEETDNFTR